MNELDAAWETAIGLAELRGWQVGRYTQPLSIHVIVPYDPESTAVHRSTFYIDAEGFANFLVLLEHGPPRNIVIHPTKLFIPPHMVEQARKLLKGTT